MSRTIVSNDLVERFCTPPPLAESPMDIRLTEDAEIQDFQFEGFNLKGYSWGAGRNILCVHGWGSRASHMAFIARFLASCGFRVTAFDGPAHGRSLKLHERNQSSLFEFCRAIANVANRLEPLYTVIGHSMGATAAAFACLGHERLRTPAINPERLVLLSPASGIARMIERFCRVDGISDRIPELTVGLEKAFAFSVADFHLPDSIAALEARLLIIHDEDDEDVPVSDAVDIQKAAVKAEALFTKGSGHQRILMSREVQRRIKDFLS